MPYRPNFPIPENINAELMCLQLMIPNDPIWKSVVAGLLYELQYWFNWQRDDEQSGRQCAAVWKEIYLNIDWSTMSCCCGDSIPVQFRWTGDFILQRSTDGGVTWVDAPEYDPRTYSPEFPPLSNPSSDSRKCDGAASIAAMFEQQIGDELTDDMARVTIDELLTDWVTTMHETSNPFITLVTVAANQIFALGVAAVRAALTTEVYEQLKCIILENISDDASFTAAAAEATRAQVQSEITGLAGLFLQHLIYLLGGVGMTNAARSGFVVDADCEECDEPEGQVIWYANANEEIIAVYPDEEGVYTLSSGSETPYAGVYYMTLHFNDGSWLGIVEGAPWPNCWRTFDPVFPEGAPDSGLFFNCETGGTGAPYCYAVVQHFKNTPWSWQFKLDTGCA